MKLKSFGPTHKARASQMLLDGTAVAAVAAHFDVHISTIYALRKDMGHGHAKADRASHVVVMRLSDVEFQALNAFVVDAGFKNRTAALRSLIRSATGFLELRRSEFVELEAFRRELRAQGTNLNQIALALNKSAFRGGAKLSRADQTFLATIARQYRALEGHVSRLFAEVRQQGRDAFHTSDKL